MSPLPWWRIFDGQMKTACHTFFALLAYSGCAVSKQAADPRAAEVASVRVSSEPRQREPLEDLVRARAKLTEQDVVAIAARAAKVDPSRFDVLVRARLESKQVTWSVQFHRPGATMVAPGTDISITVDDETRKATFDSQM